MIQRVRFSDDVVCLTARCSFLLKGEILSGRYELGVCEGLTAFAAGGGEGLGSFLEDLARRVQPEYAEAFRSVFCQDGLLNASVRGEKELALECGVTCRDGLVHWIRTCAHICGTPESGEAQFFLSMSVADDEKIMRDSAGLGMEVLRALSGRFFTAAALVDPLTGFFEALGAKENAGVPQFGDFESFLGAVCQAEGSAQRAWRDLSAGFEDGRPRTVDLGESELWTCPLGEGTPKMLAVVRSKAASAAWRAGS